MCWVGWRRDYIAFIIPYIIFFFFFFYKNCHIKNALCWNDLTRGITIWSSFIPSVRSFYQLLGIVYIFSNYPFSVILNNRAISYLVVVSHHGARKFENYYISLVYYTTYVPYQGKALLSCSISFYMTHKMFKYNTLLWICTFLKWCYPML